MPNVCSMRPNCSVPAADQTNGTMDHVRMAVNQIVENSTEQAQNSQNTSEHMRIYG